MTVTGVGELWALSAAELRAGYRAREFTPVEVVDALAARIERLNATLGAFTALCLNRARDEAAAIDIAADNRPLAGVPFAAKDLFDSAGVRTTYGSRMFTGNVPERDATALAAVRSAGAILMGKSQTHEFAWGITSVNESVGSSRNPWDDRLIPGGSSGGSAAALAARLVPLALGSDTGGSIRIPSSFCGVTGLKPTFGRIAVGGLWPLSPSLDHAGPMARTPADLALLLGVMEGVDPLPVPRGLGRVTVVTCPDLHLTPATLPVGRALGTAVDTLERLGARVEERPLGGAEHIEEAFRIIQLCEALHVHTDAGLFPSRVGEYGADVRKRLQMAPHVPPSDYVKATARREQLRSAMGRLLHDGALLITPVSAVAAPTPENTATLRSTVLPYTIPQNLAGFPSVAVRAGFDPHGLPIGIQITAPPWREADALRTARAFYDATPDIQNRWPDC
jgi:aspartyl-tRNA(Asn)/glutamyl-tRNA(Gln) amidotransferase subunit A